MSSQVHPASLAHQTTYLCTHVVNVLTKVTIQSVATHGRRGHWVQRLRGYPDVSTREGVIGCGVVGTSSVARSCVTCSGGYVQWCTRCLDPWD